MLSITPIEVAPSLKPLVERFFFTTGTVPEGQTWEHTAMPSIMQSLLFNLTGSMPRIVNDQTSMHVGGNLIIGQHTRRFQSFLTGELGFLGVHFSPTGLYRLLNQNMSAFANRILPIEVHLAQYKLLHSKLREQSSVEGYISVLESFIESHALPLSPTLEAVGLAAQLICDSNGSKPLSQIATSSGLSERSMQRYFSEYIGVSPKSFARIARFNAVTRLMETEPSLRWPTILAEIGYFDAAHFAKDFKALSGQTPSAYYKGKTAYEAFFYGT